MSGSEGGRLTDYILDAVKEQLQLELGRNVSLYPAELLADRFLNVDQDRYRGELKKFLRDPRYFNEDEFEEVDDFLRDIRENRSPEYKRSRGNKLWRFYDEYLDMPPRVKGETEDVLGHMVETVLAEGYSGLLLVLDEVSLFMKDRRDEQRTEDERTLVVVSNRLAKVKNLPVWTVCAAQQAIESKMGVKNIIADDRLKEVRLPEQDNAYYDIVLARVRKITDEGAIANYYRHYKRGFTWPNSVREAEFNHFFPFHRPALEVLRNVTLQLTTARTAIQVMHQVLKHQVKTDGRELIRLWELFDETVRYEEDPSGVSAGLAAIRDKFEADLRAYDACRQQIDGLTSGLLKVQREKAVRVIQTLLLYHIAHSRQRGLTAEEIANGVLIDRDADSTPAENIQHYETLADKLKTELRQVAESFDDDGTARYRFDPVLTGIDPRHEFQRARDAAEGSELARQEAWEQLARLGEWRVQTRQATLDLSGGMRSIFSGLGADQNPEIRWRGRQVFGLVAMRDLANVPALPPIDTEGTDRDFAVFIGTRAAEPRVIERLLAQANDPRVILWTPAPLTTAEEARLLDFAAYRKLVADLAGEGQRRGEHGDPVGPECAADQPGRHPEDRGGVLRAGADGRGGPAGDALHGGGRAGDDPDAGGRPGPERDLPVGRYPLRGQLLLPGRGSGEGDQRDREDRPRRAWGEVDAGHERGTELRAGAEDREGRAGADAGCGGKRLRAGHPAFPGRQAGRRRPDDAGGDALQELHGHPQLLERPELRPDAADGPALPAVPGTAG
jgi:hypothetical protein